MKQKLECGKTTTQKNDGDDRGRYIGLEREEIIAQEDEDHFGMLAYQSGSHKGRRFHGKRERHSDFGEF